MTTNVEALSVKDYKALHEQKLEELKKKIYSSAIYDKLALKALSNEAIDSIITKMNAIISPRKVWEDFNFRTGKLLGILRSIAQNPTKRAELLAVTGLSQTHVDLYFEVCGNLPFLRNDNTIDPGRPMQVEECKELLMLIGSHFNYAIDESDFSDMTEERWHHLTKNALERCTETAQHNKEHGGEEAVTYEE